MLTTQEVAEQLDITRPRVHALIQAGRLPAVKMGRDYFIKESDLALVADRKPGRPKKETEENKAQTSSVKKRAAKAKTKN